MLTLLTSSEARSALASNVRERRLAMDLTQTGLSRRSGVSLGTLRKFEREGCISLKSLTELMQVVGGLEEIVQASALPPVEFRSIEDVIAGKARSRRKRGSVS